MIPTSTRVSISSASAVPGNADAVAVFIPEKTKAIEDRALSSAERKAAERLISAGVARGKAKEVAAELVEGNGKKSRHVMVVGIGRGEKLTAEIIRQAAGGLAKAARKRRGEESSAFCTAAWKNFRETAGGGEFFRFFAGVFLF